MDASVGVFAIVWLLIVGVGFLVSMGLLGFWVWMLIDCIKNTPETDNKKLIWILVIVLANWIGALIYYFVQRPNNGLVQA